MKLTFRVHAIRRMRQWQITAEEVRHVLKIGESIERYPEDRPYPSRLVLGWSRGRPIHVVAADNEAEQEIIIITVYEPDPRLWDPTFRTRRRPPE